MRDGSLESMTIRSDIFIGTYRMDLPVRESNYCY